MNCEISKILNYWFDGDKSKWFKNDSMVDNYIRENFKENILKAKNGEYNSWKEDKEGFLALIILLDQFSRNVFRGEKEAFAQDGKALFLSMECIDRGFDKKLDPDKRIFIYMPLMHAENLSVQENCVLLFDKLQDEFGEFEKICKYAREHRDIIKKFGRFPYRNEILSRKSTKEENDFLKVHKGF